MKDLLFIDIETYSSVDISKAGAYKYIESPDFEILIISYAINQGPVITIDLLSENNKAEETEKYKELIKLLKNPEIIKVAHNAVFERRSFARVGIDVPIEQWYCTAVKAAYCGLPISLDSVSKVLDLEDKKLSTGKALIKYFSCPCKPTKVNGGRTRNFPEHNPEKWAMYKEYNVYDVLSEREIYYRLEKYVIPEIERKLYVVDQQINDNGILVDTDLAQAAIDVDTRYSEILTDRAKRLSHIENPNSAAQIKAFIKLSTGEEVESLAKEAIPDLIAKFKDTCPEVSELLELRKRLSKTSVKKYYAMTNCAMSDDRARGMFQFYGANRTGRWAGRLIQLQNLSKNHIETISEARELVRKRDIDAIEIMYDDVSDILSQLVRTAFIAPAGKTLVVADFSAIEARVISWLAEEEWRMDVFRGDGKIYEATGSKMFNVPISSITKGSDLRQKSKISELALGYGGSIGALKRMGGEKMGLADAEMMSLVRKWRLANPKIVELWDALDKATKEVCVNGTTVVINNKIKIYRDSANLIIQLPSGRELFYRHPMLKTKPGTRLASLFYEGVLQETKQWTHIDTYGGKLTENCVQAIARDLLAYSMMLIAKAGETRDYKIVGHIHDEVLVEVPAADAKEHYKFISDLMSNAPEWASELPLRADGYITPFYLKD